MFEVIRFHYKHPPTLHVCIHIQDNYCIGKLFFFSKFPLLCKYGLYDSAIISVL